MKSTQIGNKEPIQDIKPITAFALVCQGLLLVDACVWLITSFLGTFFPHSDFLGFIFVFSGFVIFNASPVVALLLLVSIVLQKGEKLRILLGLGFALSLGLWIVILIDMHNSNFSAGAVSL